MRNHELNQPNRPMRRKLLHLVRGKRMAPAGTGTAATERQMSGRERLKNQVLLVYGAGLAIGMHLGMLNLMMNRKLSSALYVIGSSLVNATVVLGLWQWVLPRFS